MAVLEKEPYDAKMSKVKLFKSLFHKGWKHDDILTLMTFIDWVITLPKSLEDQCQQEMEIYEEEAKVAYITTFERHGIKKGIQQGLEQGIELGVQKGEVAVLLRQLQRKFKIIPDSYREKIEGADAETLLIWSDRILDGEGLEEIFRA